MRLWGGRFTGETDPNMDRFSSSVAFDRRLWAADTRGSKAYARALERAGILSTQECGAILQGLATVEREFESSTFEFLPTDEDIHTAVERRLAELLGSVAGKLHTGRSRNDQVATDVRLYTLEQITSLRPALADLQRALVRKAEEHPDIIMPGYTHGQQAQPVLFAHWLLSYFWALQRDRDRLTDLEKRVSVLPLGSGALAGNPFGVDREYLARELGFARVSENSIDAVSDRDFVIEFLAWGAVLGMHLSRLSADLIGWTSQEYAFVQLDDAYSTGSSLMPQKKNPDSLELIRGKTGRLTGHLVSLLVMMKGLPTGYYRDLQEDKEPLFDAVDTLGLALTIMAGVVRTLRPNAQRMEAVLSDGMLATDLSDYLVRKGVPFRQAHGLVGEAIREAEERGVPLRGLPLEGFQAISSAFDSDLYSVFEFRSAVEARDVDGGTASSAVDLQLQRARALLSADDGQGLKCDTLRL